MYKSPRQKRCVQQNCPFVWLPGGGRPQTFEIAFFFLIPRKKKSRINEEAWAWISGGFLSRDTEGGEREGAYRGVRAVQGPDCFSVLGETPLDSIRGHRESHSAQRCSPGTTASAFGVVFLALLEAPPRPFSFPVFLQGERSEDNSQNP